MAGLSFHRDRWIVSTIVDGKRRFRHFADKADAEAYMKANGLTHRPRGGTGRAARNRAEVIEHIARNYEVNEAGCWIWTGPLTTAGYPRMSWRPAPDASLIPGGHRVVLHAVGQPVPQDKVVDHLCRNRACVNPDHLEVVRQRENVMRSPIAPGAINARKTHCANGHPYSPENTYTYTFKTRGTTVRTCRTCRDAYRKARRARLMGADKAVAS